MLCSPKSPGPYCRLHGCQKYALASRSITHHYGLVPALSEVAAALDAVNGFRDSPTGTLKLNVPTIVGRLIMPPIVEGFLKAHPAVTIEITTEDSFIDSVT